MMQPMPQQMQQQQPQQTAAPAAGSSFVDTGHTEMIHEAVFDYYGKRLATCSSDRVVKIFDIAPNGQQTLSAELRGHEGAVWQVCWAHPKFGTILASAGYDKRVNVWKETGPGAWTMVYQYNGHEASVNSIAFCPHELGLSLACASADGSLSVLTWKGTKENDWHENRMGALLRAHQIGCNAVDWAPATADPRVTAAGGQPSLQRRFVSGGCDNAVRIWSMSEQGHWDCQTLSTPEGVSHVDWVRDVAWAPNIVGLPMNIIASCAADKRVIIWTVDGSNVQATQLPPFDQTVWRVSWSATGSVLAVVVGDSRVLLFKNVNGEWRCVQTLVDQHQ
mmetsp:Transcript_39437/g.85418  ORF Transcript_39437/g.85418 Transcript_39437/m.85418 type:complete len:334 (-) Transcript_39437:40-1041(-)